MQFHAMLSIHYLSLLLIPTTQNTLNGNKKEINATTASKHFFFYFKPFKNGLHIRIDAALD